MSGTPLGQSRTGVIKGIEWGNHLPPLCVIKFMADEMSVFGGRVDLGCMCTEKRSDPIFKLIQCLSRTSHSHNPANSVAIS